MDNNYKKAYTEVVEVLKYVPNEELKKIPQEIIQALNEFSDKNYEYKIDKSVPFENQILLDETKSILAVLFRDYWATDYQREQILISEKIEENKLNEELSKNYNPDDLFKNRKKNNLFSSSEMIVYEEKWYKKFLKYIKNFFRK